MSPFASVYISPGTFIQHLQELYIEMNTQFEAKNTSYKFRTDLHKKHIEFNIEDSIMIQIKLEQCPLDLCPNCRSIMLVLLNFRVSWSKCIYY